MKLNIQVLLIWHCQKHGIYIVLLGSDIVGAEKWNYAVKHSTLYLYIRKITSRRLDSNQEWTKWHPPDVRSHYADADDYDTSCFIHSLILTKFNHIAANSAQNKACSAYF